VTCCFSKGLGAPVGSILCGSRDIIEQAHRWRKLVGGGMRQAGLLAAAAIHAIDNHVERLAQDHDNARWIANQLEQIDELEVDYGVTQTNMVFVSMPHTDVHQLAAFLQEQSILVLPGSPMRIVTHLDVDRKAAAALVAGIKAFFAAKSGLSAAHRVRDDAKDFKHHRCPDQGRVT